MKKGVTAKTSGVRSVWHSALKEAIAALNLAPHEFPEMTSDRLNWSDWYDILRTSVFSEIRPHQWRALGQRLAVRPHILPVSFLISPKLLTRISLRFLLPRLASGIQIKIQSAGPDQLAITAGFPGGETPAAWPELFAGVLEGIPLNIGQSASRAILNREKEAWTFSLELPPSRTLLARSTSVLQILRSRKKALATLVRQQSALTRKFQELQILHEEQARLEADVQRAADGEREKLAFDLHDGLGQLLTGISLHSQALANNLTRDQQKGKHVESATRLAELASEANRRTRLLSRGLNPVSEFEGGFSEALRTLCESFPQAQKVHCQIISAPVLTRSQEIQVYRVAQEALNNALKHSNASVVSLQLSADELTISDEGRGFDLKQARQLRTLGLRSLEYRARIIDAHLDITSSSETGTEVRLSFQNSSKNHDANPHH